MSTALDAPGRLEFAALGTTALLVVTAPDRMSQAEAVLRAELAAIDEACSRFRADSEISRLHLAAGRAVTVGPLRGEALAAAFRAAELTGGLVDPTVGAAVCVLGYDCDFAAIPSDRPGPPPPRPAPGWRRLKWNPAHPGLLLPRGVSLDLGAIAKALAADRAARHAANAAGCGVLVGLGGDIAMAGVAPDGGWRVAVADDHRNALHQPAQTISMSTGGLATSSTVTRTWLRGRDRHHHIVDPRTGANPDSAWRTVSVSAASCVDANTASTAAIVLGDAAPGWLAGLGLPARMVTKDGQVHTTGGWPDLEDGG